MSQSAGLPRVLVDGFDNLGAAVYRRVPGGVKGQLKSLKARGEMIQRAPEVVAALSAVAVTFASKAGRFMWTVRLVGSLLVAVGIVGHLLLRVKSSLEFIQSALKPFPIDYLTSESGIQPHMLSGHVAFQAGKDQVFQLQVNSGTRRIHLIEFFHIKV